MTATALAQAELDGRIGHYRTTRAEKEVPVADLPLHRALRGEAEQATRLLARLDDPAKHWKLPSMKPWVS